VKKFKKGDTVIYPQHGACTVKAIKRIRAFDVMQDYLILETVMTDTTGNGMTLSVPVAKCTTSASAHRCRRASCKTSSTCCRSQIRACQPTGHVVSRTTKKS